MFDIGFRELVVIGVAALVVLGPAGCRRDQPPATDKADPGAPPTRSRPSWNRSSSCRIRTTI